ncbi:pilus assembly protein PilP [Pokkaliibacter sp. CJK22405]|uniref:pilus assembly protein PilP n=1 Tax=Pokkaliibacter sp. CJK22405 TaxID=3384615 RepID=UPI0039851829
MKILTSLLALSLVAGLSGCSPSVPTDDLQRFVEKAQSRQPDPLDPLPPLPEYRVAPYSVTSLREPFTNPDVEILQKQQDEESAIKPDLNREKQPLESFELDALSFVGLMKKENTQYAVIKAPDGQLHLVAKGDYMGKNYGRIVAITVEDGESQGNQLDTRPPLKAQLELEEIIPTSDNHWRVRPRVISMQFSDN